MEFQCEENILFIYMRGNVMINTPVLIFKNKSWLAKQGTSGAVFT